MKKTTYAAFTRVIQEKADVTTYQTKQTLRIYF